MSYHIDSGTPDTVLCLIRVSTPKLPYSLESKTSQPCFDFQNAVALYFNGSTCADANIVLLGILWNGNLQGCSQFIQEHTSIARDFFDPGCDSSTILSIFRIHGQKSNRIVGFVLGSSDSKGVFREFCVVVASAERRVPSVLKNDWVRNDRRQSRFRNDSFVVVVEPRTRLRIHLFFSDGDPTFCGILFEESLDLCRRMFGSDSDVVVVAITIIIVPRKITSRNRGRCCCCGCG